MKYCVYFLFSLSLFFSCTDGSEVTDSLANDDVSKVNDTIIDAHTLSNYKEVSISHTHLDIEVDFINKRIKGVVSHTIDNSQNKDQIILDTKNLEIFDVTLDDGDSATYSYGDNDELLGLPLIINLKQGTKKINIAYSTTDGTEALDWLVPEQTAGKNAPFMYTQGQSIFTRSWIPIQDTPGKRITYSANVKVPDGMLAVMSASNPVERNPQNTYEFNMPQPIPCYLIALAVGDLYFAPIDHRTGVYTEKSMLDACAYELGDMGKMVDVAEDLYGEYQWERYDVIVLPPSFPFGGMENPRLTFATPTMIAGDRSLTSLIAHELAHSWSGNLVTNATWEDFWLNEGFTVYFERRIMEELYGKDYVEMLALLGYQDLEQDVASLDPKLQLLKLKLKGNHPDDGMSNIAYEKGYSFLRYIEESAGRSNFDTFLKKYFDDHKFQTIITEYFVGYLQRNLLFATNLDLNVNEWVFQPGIPKNCPKVVSSRFENVEEKLKLFYYKSDINVIDADNWSTHEWRHFIRNLNANTTSDQMRIIDQKYDLTHSGNSEILAAWFEQSIKFGYEGIYPALENFLVRVGRRKFLQPIYQALANSDEGMKRAKEIYSKARKNYHYISFETIDEILKLKDKVN